MNELALYAGVCGGGLASILAGHRIVCYVEWYKYCVEVLQARIRDGYLSNGPIWDDVNTFDGRPWAGRVDCLSAGFPCQPFSTAGKRLAEFDPRNGWPSTKRIIGEVRPWILKLENVPGLLSKSYIRRIFGDLAELGYDAEWGCLSAKAVGAPHVRNRLWILAYAASVSQQLRQLTREEGFEPAGIGFGGNASSADGTGETSGWQNHGMGRTQQSIAITNSDFQGLEVGQGEPGDNGKKSPTFVRSNWRFSQPPVCGRNDDVAHRVDRLKATGNGQVSAVAYNAFKMLERRISE
jgi:DNA (cytosine-5)-methyltransferase 1